MKQAMITVTVLTENTVHRPDLIAEHGLSLYIETGSARILFDMGQTDAFLRNAKVLGIDLSRVDLAILSHGHYDHGGGLARFLQINDRAPVYLRESAFLPHYNGASRYNGLDASLKDSPRLIFTADHHPIAPGLTLVSGNERERITPLSAFGLFTEENGARIPDHFEHEQYLLIEEGDRRILISGCSHKGIRDLMAWYRPDVVIGGFHLMKEGDPATLDRIACTLKEYDTEYYTCHCTGIEAYGILKRRMDRLHYLSCADRITL